MIELKIGVKKGCVCVLIVCFVYNDINLIYDKWKFSKYK